MRPLAPLSGLGRRRYHAPLTYRNMVLSHGAMAYWRLGEASGIIAADETGAYPGAYTPNSGGVWTGGTQGQPGAIAGDSSTAISPNGTTGRMAASMSVSYPFTLECWARKSATGNKNLFVVGNAGGSIAGGVASTATGNGAFQLYSNGTNNAAYDNATSASTHALNQWYHVVAVFASATDRRLYQDTVLVASSTVNRILSGVTVATVGAFPNSVVQGWQGLIAHSAIYPNASTMAQIIARNNKGLTG